MRLQSQKGVSAVEFAIILPVLLLLLFGIIEFSLLLYNKQMLTNASREGARAGIVAQDRSNTNAIDSVIRGVVSNYAKNHLVTFGSDSIEQDADDIPITWGGTASSGDDLTVEINYNYDFLVLPSIIVALFSGNMDGTFPLHAVTVMRLE